MLKLRLLFFPTFLIASFALAGEIHKGPRVLERKSITGDEPMMLSRSVAYPQTSMNSPGDSIGFTTYDYGTNGAVLRNLVVYGDGAIAFARLGAHTTSTADRGTWYSFSTDRGRTWPPLTKIEIDRTNWGQIDQMRDSGGVEAVVSHLVLHVNVDSARGANRWTESTSGQNSIWPHFAVGSGGTFHIVANLVSPPMELGYTRSTDGGVTFDRVNVNIFGSVAGWTPDADGYDVAARGSKAAIVLAGICGDVALLTSTNFGTSWIPTVVYEITPNPPPPGEFQPDGSCATIIDSVGTVHVAWSNYFSRNDSLFYSIDAPIMYWNSASATIQNIAYPTPDTTMSWPPGRDGNYASMPDFALGPGGNIYLIFSQLISERDDSSKNYEHVYAARSTDYGTTWGAAVDITPGTGFDASFPSVADDADDSLYIVYNSDRLAGNFVQGNHPVTQVAINFLKVPVSTLPLTGIRELQARIPTQFQLLQNYPNPFNSETHIRYSLPRQAQVTLGIYNVLGQEVTRLVDDIKPAGTDEVVWDGSDRAGIRVASSVYLLRLSTEGRQMTKLMMLIR